MVGLQEHIERLAREHVIRNVSGEINTWQIIYKYELLLYSLLSRIAFASLELAFFQFSIETTELLLQCGILLVVY